MCRIMAGGVGDLWTSMMLRTSLQNGTVDVVTLCANVETPVDSLTPLQVQVRR